MNNGKRSVTFSDISKATGLSKSTISRYFNNPNYLTEENKLIISETLKTLDYQENKLAKIFAKKNTEIIGVIVPNFFYQFYSYFLNHLLDTYDQFGFKFITFLGNHNPESEKKYLSELLSYQIVGLIQLSHNLPSEYFASLGIPVVTIEREDRYISSVNTNNLLGAKLAVDLLAKNRCDILIHVNSNVETSIPSYGRIQGFTDSCLQSQLKNELFLYPFTDVYEDTYNILYGLYRDIKKKYPTQKKGFFFCNDTYANIFLNILFINHESIPDEYELIGFDNSPNSPQAIIPITTIGQNITALAQNAIESIAQQIDSINSCSSVQTAINHIIIPPTLIERQTTSL